MQHQKKIRINYIKLFDFGKFSCGQISLLKLVQTDTQTVHNLIGFSEFIYSLSWKQLVDTLRTRASRLLLSTKLVKYLQVTQLIDWLGPNGAISRSMVNLLYGIYMARTTVTIITVKCRWWVYQIFLAINQSPSCLRDLSKNNFQSVCVITTR